MTVTKRLTKFAERVKLVCKDIRMIYNMRRFKYHDRRANYYSDKLFAGKTVVTVFSKGAGEEIV